MNMDMDDFPSYSEYFMGDYKSRPVTIQEELQPKEFVHSLVKENRIVVFSKSQCPHCINSKSLLSNLGVQFKAVELDQMKEGSEVQNTLAEITNARTVPRIFIDGKCVGGNSDLQLLNTTGQLMDCLKI